MRLSLPAGAFAPARRAALRTAPARCDTGGMTRDDAQVMLGRMADVEALRGAQRADARRAAQVHRVRVFQVRRFEYGYADLLADARHGPVAHFFLDELYGARAFDERDAQFTRVIPTVGRFFPQEVVTTVDRLTELLALSEGLDDAMGRALAEPVGADAPVAPEAYAAAWRATGHPEARRQQVELTLAIGRDLQRYTASRLIRTTLKLMRGAARAAGLQSLQRFLETGFDAFAGMRGADDFLATVAERETRLCHALFASAGRGAEASAWRALLPP